MPNQIQSTGEIILFTGNDNNDKRLFDLRGTTDCTGSGYVGSQVFIASGSATPLYTASINNVSLMLFGNKGSGSIQVASDSTFTKILTTLDISGSGKAAKIPWSSSIANCPVFARCTNQAGGSYLDYYLREK